MNKTNKRLAVAFTGPSNSGKTTLIVKIATMLQEEGLKVAIIKHDPCDKAIFDKEGKDSYKFSQTGSEVAVVSPTRTTVFKKETSTIEDMVSMFGDFDILLVEGLKTIPLPRVCVQRDTINDIYFEKSDCIATDNSIDKEKLPQNMVILDLNNTQDIIEWIKQNGQKI
ncbi:MAG: molybdopterin-guanine dinucleotide biosynthesis protein B [Arcobacteraceae bacterium]|nr:molybdopterin-guanine dinucleotide biosynthesis protein B [Arcobacteraceae bacterium]